MTVIGFIGLGHMGTPMVKNLLKNNFEVKVYDVLGESMTALIAEGAIGVQSPAEIAKDADVVFTMLQTGDQVKQSCLGEHGIFAHLNKPTALYIDSSSVDIQSAHQLHQQAESCGIPMLDAPVSGGVAAAIAATLTFMVGGEADDFERAKSILSAMGEKIIHAGPAGRGAAAKICNNMILGVSMIAVCEAFILADKLGLEAKKLFEISTNASGQCWSLSKYCPWPDVLPNVPANNHYQPGFTAQMMLKDLHLSQDAATHVNAQTPLGKHAMDLYQQFVESDHADIDFSGIIEMLAETKK